MFKGGLVVAGALVVSILLGSTWSQGQQIPAPGGQMQHEQMMPQPAAQYIPTLPGQDAFGAIQEIVRILEADPATGWSPVNLERLRQHLIDMNDVTLRSEVKSAVAPGGLAMDVTSAGRTEQAIRRMVVPHTVELNRMPEWSAQAEEIPGGLRLTVVAKNPDDARTIARIRGLGFIGLRTEGFQHQPHHLAMAKGEDLEGHGH